jgi:hypothetical protein
VKNWDTLAFHQARMQWASDTVQNVPDILMLREYGVRAAIDGSGTEKVARKEPDNARHLLWEQRCSSPDPSW